MFMVMNQCDSYFFAKKSHYYYYFILIRVLNQDKENNTIDSCESLDQTQSLF